MGKPTVYIEASIVSYYTGRPTHNAIVQAHRRTTREWWRQVLPQCDAFISELVVAEASAGDPGAAARRLEALRPLESLEITEDAEDLAALYVRRIAALAGSPRDALHLAIASSAGMDFLLTWNCTHIASGTVRKALEEINDSESIGTPTICTPEELWELPQ